MDDNMCTVLHVLNNFMSDKICTKSQLEKIKTITYDKYDKMISMLNNQTNIHDFANSYSLYSIPIAGGEVSHVTDIYGDIGNMFTTTVQSDGVNVYLHTLTPESIMMYIVENNKGNRYVFIPATFGSEIKNPPMYRY